MRTAFLCVFVLFGLAPGAMAQRHISHTDPDYTIAHCIYTYVYQKYFRYPLPTDYDVFFSRHAKENKIKSYVENYGNLKIYYEYNRTGAIASLYYRHKFPVYKSNGAQKKNLWGKKEFEKRDSVMQELYSYPEGTNVILMQKNIIRNGDTTLYCNYRYHYNAAHIIDTAIATVGKITNITVLTIDTVGDRISLKWMIRNSSDIFSFADTLAIAARSFHFGYSFINSGNGSYPYDKFETPENIFNSSKHTSFLELDADKRRPTRIKAIISDSCVYIDYNETTRSGLDIPGARNRRDFEYDRKTMCYSWDKNGHLKKYSAYQNFNNPTYSESGRNKERIEYTIRKPDGTFQEIGRSIKSVYNGKYIMFDMGSNITDVVYY